MNFAIVGCGFIAQKHAKAIEKTLDAKLVAVCDKVDSAMEYYASTYSTSTYNDFSEMLDKEDIDVVCICTPSGFHMNLAVEAAELGMHIIVEKPIAMTLEDSERMLVAASENNVKLSVVHPNRFRPVVQELKKIVDSDKLGSISHANCIINWNRNQEYYDQAQWRGTKQFDGGVLMNQAIHNLDLLLWFMGEPTEVFSMEATRLREIEAEDVSVGVVRFKSGALASIQASSTVYPKNFEESITLFGEHGTVKIGGANALYFEHLEVKGMDNLAIEALKNKVKEDPWGTPGHEWIIKDMVQSIKEDRNPSVNGKDGELALKLVLKMYESANNCEKVNFS